MRWSINFNQAVNKLVPPFMTGRKYVLFIQSLVKPLQALSDSFAASAPEFRRDACTTSRIIQMVHYLNHKYSGYFSSSSGSFSITNAVRQGRPFYSETASTSYTSLRINPLYGQSESGVTHVVALKYESEQGDLGGYSFLVHSPAINTALISQTDYVALVTATVNKYKISNKTFKIVFD